MNREYQAHKFFCVNAEFHILICQKYQYTVYRTQVKVYLTSSIHRIPSIWTQYIYTTIQQWDYINNQPEMEHWPRQVDKPIPELPIHKNRILCLQYEIYIYCQISIIKIYWLNIYQYRVQQNYSYPTPIQI